jgi:aryl-phospho-beta-D-glucosidase BglC (GH1 family)
MLRRSRRVFPSCGIGIVPAALLAFLCAACSGGTGGDSGDAAQAGTAQQAVQTPAEPDPAPTPAPAPAPEEPSPAPEPPLPPPSGAGSGFFSMSGATMVDENGQPVRLTGVNWFGFETANRVVHGLWSRDYRSMLHQVRDLGFNAVRIPWSNAILEPGSTPNGITFSGSDPYDGESPMNQPLQGRTSMEVLDRVIAEARRLGLKVILDNHSRKPDDFASEGLWYLPDFPESRWIADWKLMAERYRDEPTVVAFDLHNEPHDGATWGSDPATDFAAAAERAAAAVHSVHPDVIIIVGGVQTVDGISYWWGGNLRGVRNRPLDIDPAKLLYSAHDYGPEVFAQTWFSAPDYPDNLFDLWDATWGYIPRLGLGGVFIGEFGIGHADAYGGKALQWIQTLMSYVGRSSSWTYWCLNPNSGDTGGILKDDWVSVQQWKMDLLKPYLARQFPTGP